MQQVNLHKIKLFALLEAGMALIGLFLDWTIETYPSQLGGMTSVSQNGFNSWGWLGLVGVIGIVIVSLLMGDKTKDYDQNSKNIAMVSFLAIVAGALIYYFRLSSEAKDFTAQYARQGITYSAKAGIGVWLTLAAGIIGLAWVSGVINKISAPPAAGAAPVAPPPPPSTPQS